MNNKSFNNFELFILFLSGVILFIIGLLILKNQINDYGFYNFILNVGFALFTEGIFIIFFIFYLIIKHNIKVKNENNI
jgi:hypothetical protein